MRQNEVIAKKLAESLSFIDIVEGEFSTKIFYQEKIIGSQGSIGFKREAISIIQGCVDDILGIKHSKFGPLYKSLDNEHVYNFLTEITSDAKKNPESNKYDLLLIKLDEFIKNLKIFTFSSYIKIGCLKVTKKHDFGSFKFFPNHEKFLEELTKEKEDHIRQKILRDFQKNSDFFSSVMELQVQALDEKQAKTKTLQNVVDILNIFKVLGAKGIIHEGETQLGYHDVYLLNHDTGTMHQIAQIENVGKIGALFDLDMFEQKNPHIVNKIKSCFNPEGPTPLERKMINSLIWLGESIYETHMSHRLLKMIISIESLLLDSDDRGTKSYLLEERAAFLLGNNYEVRCFVGDTIKEAYNVRNTIVHSGDKHPIPLRLIKRLLFVSHDLNMLFLTSGKYKTFEDIRVEVRNKKFQKITESH
jgi:hypothetical protein